MIEISEVAASESALRLVVRGELDSATAPALRESLLATLRPHREVTLDLDQLDFMDSSGLGVLVGTTHAAAAQQGRFRVETSRELFLSMFEITGIAGILGVGPGGEPHATV